MRSLLRFLAAFSFIWFAAPPVLAAPGPDQLGKVNFPTSCAAAVQPAIEKGVALLHSFQYTEADQTFTDVTARDPRCAMAHWGKAMALYYQLWEFPDDQKMKTGHEEMEKARKLHPATEREQGFVNAATAFYQKKKMSHEARIRAYSGALEKLYARNPGDADTGSFYALSLVSLGYAVQEDNESLAHLREAIAILKPLLKAHPDHPGVAHYLIHAADRPEFAAQGLEAARLYAGIAPDSSHALHMPSHIFARLGLWQDSIASNVAAQAAGAHAAEMHHAEAHYQTHAMDYLSYAYLQSGQEAKARDVIEQVDKVVGASDAEKKRMRAYLAARTALELHHWKEAAALPAQTSGADMTMLVRAIGAARTGDTAEAESAVRQLTQSVAERQAEARKAGYPPTKEKATDLAEAEAWLAFAKGKTDEAVAELRAAADRDDKNGGEAVAMPAREMLADMLMEAKRPSEALTEYKLALQHAPNRFDGLLGAARALQAAGSVQEAQSYYAKLEQVCTDGADRPELSEAKTFLASR